MARAAGVAVELEINEGMWHVFQAFANVMPEATKALVRAATFIRTHSPAALVAEPATSPSLV